MIISAIISGLALLLSAVSLFFSRRSWRETYRPIVVARVATVTAGNLATCYNLVVENCGNRPARNVRLRVADDILSAALNPAARDDSEGIRVCFSDDTHIHVLANGASTSAYFGFTSAEKKESTWIPKSKFDIELTYEGFDGTQYSSSMPLQIAVGPSFTGWQWGDAKKG